MGRTSFLPVAATSLWPCSVGAAGHNRGVKLRRLRDGGDLPDGDVVLVRGGVLDPAILRADALRYHDVYGGYGISVFAVLGATLEEMSQPTGRNPRHYTVSFEDLEKGLTQLVGCARQVVPNAYFDA
jgi:hypothetical protein